MMQVERFGMLADGQEVSQYTLTNETGMKLKLLDYGGIIRELWIPDKEGNAGNIVLSYDSLDDYVANPAYVGAIIGRAAGRIENGTLHIGPDVYGVPRNNGTNSLHGGPDGFHQKCMHAEYEESADALELTLSFGSADGESGFPGNLALQLIYRLSRREKMLSLEMRGTTDCKTYLNMTHHGYFNLSGNGNTIEAQVLQLNADAYARVDGAMLPKSGWTPVGGSCFDLQNPTPITRVLNADDEQISLARGVDHPFRLNGKGPGNVRNCAILSDEKSGRTMTVSTDQPHLVVYTGNYLDEAVVPSGKRFLRHQGICFEAQEVPNAPGNPSFSCTYLEPGEVYSKTLCYTFD